LHQQRASDLGYVNAMYALAYFTVQLGLVLHNDTLV
jgi:hypothetical protein